MTETQKEAEVRPSSDSPAPEAASAPQAGAAATSPAEAGKGPAGFGARFSIFRRNPWASAVAVLALIVAWQWYEGNAQMASVRE